MAHSWRAGMLAIAVAAVGVMSTVAATASPGDALAAPAAAAAAPAAPAAAPAALPKLPSATITSAPAAALAVSAPSAPVLAAGTPCLVTAKACIKLSTNQAWLIANNGILYGPVPITHGRPGWTTPPGTFHVTFKSKMHYSTLFNNAPMPNSVFFNGGIAFHDGSLQVQSHGCVHLSTAASLVFYNTLNPGDVVQVVP
ncbi:MAG: ErfK/YbiS/YcfS/YnhG family protein [Pseudonocardia sp.]|nr:ErfK/YbiS/YcfS/YnhG family protein [Pseudonocardia sp.]